eukprot:9470176-Pyramimonas_sp.AAC.1
MSRATTPFGAPQSAGSTNRLQARLQSVRMDPQLYQALQATSPFASPRPIAGQPDFSDHEVAQRAESMTGQQQWMHRQMREAMPTMRRDGHDLPSASWTPPWEYIPDPNRSADNPNRYGFVPAFFSHPTYNLTAAERPTAPPMDAPMFPDYYAQETGNPRAGSHPDNLYVRATADDCYQSQLTRGSGLESGVL